MLKSNRDGESLKGNDKFEGYIVELMERIAEEAKESHDLSKTNLTKLFVCFKITRVQLVDNSKCKHVILMCNCS